MRHETPITPGSPVFAAAGRPIEPAEQEVLDRAVTDLAAARADWAGLPLPDRIRILDEVLAGLQRVAERWVSASLAAKDMPLGHARMTSARTTLLILGGRSP